MKKIIHPYNIIEGNRNIPVFCKIEIEDGNLSISGVEGPKHNGDARGSFGQIIMGFKEFDTRGYMSISDVIPAAGWDIKKVTEFLTVWDYWHLNDMRAECEHQRALAWTYENHHGAWRDRPRKVVVIDEYDDGTSNDPVKYWDSFHGHECPVCGYSIGSAWLKEKLPPQVEYFLFTLPNTDVNPAWV